MIETVPEQSVFSKGYVTVHRVYVVFLLEKVNEFYLKLNLLFFVSIYLFNSIKYTYLWKYKLIRAIMREIIKTLVRTLHNRPKGTLI